jgi:hypothetical protein
MAPLNFDVLLSVKAAKTHVVCSWRSEFKGSLLERGAGDLTLVHTTKGGVV